jgi:N-acetylmuramoyl-L-alanine amidase
VSAAHDIDILARTIWGEARGESFDGRLAVAWVAVNRLKRGRYGDTLAEVCLRPKQFSCWNEDDPNRPKMLGLKAEDPIFAECLGIAALVYAASKGRGGALPADLKDATLNSTHYCVSSLDPYWARGKTPTCSVGRHKFFNDID